MTKSPEDRACANESQAVVSGSRSTSGGLDPALRFDRQVRFAPLGRAGQAGLVSARVLVVGCGALGGVLAQQLFRAGVGELLLVDRDVVEPSNLPRQVLFDERHARAGTPKAVAARETLEASGGPTQVRAYVQNLDARNLELLAEDVDLLLDGTDNLATRYLLNDFSVLHEIPWIYAGVVGSAGLVMPILPRRSACLACLFPVPPADGELPTCESAGVLLPAVAAVASFAAGFALRLLARADHGLEPALLELDTWNGGVRRLSVPRDPECRVCAHGEYSYLYRSGAEALALCGRNTVQIPAQGAPVPLGTRAAHLPSGASDVRLHTHLLRFQFDGCRVSLFPDGRALIEGTSDLRRAAELFARLAQPSTR